METIVSPYLATAGTGHSNRQRHAAPTHRRSRESGAMPARRHPADPQFPDEPPEIMTEEVQIVADIAAQAPSSADTEFATGVQHEIAARSFPPSSPDSSVGSVQVRGIKRIPLQPAPASKHRRMNPGTEPQPGASKEDEPQPIPSRQAIQEGRSPARTCPSTSIPQCSGICCDFLRHAETARGLAQEFRHDTLRLQEMLAEIRENRQEIERRLNEVRVGIRQLEELREGVMNDLENCRGR